jgi:hypothetical protein
MTSPLCSASREDQMSDYVNKSLIELWDAATALHDLLEKAASIFPVEHTKPIIAAIASSVSNNFKRLEALCEELYI